MTHIAVNGTWVDWPKQTIAADALRAYGSAGPEATITQNHPGSPRTTTVTHVADLRDGTVFTTKEADHG